VATEVRLTDLTPAGGCAAKYAAAGLRRLLEGLAPAADANLLVGHATADDAAVYRLDDERALVFTLDFFPPLVDDPAEFGAIAATNALNDVYAMGGAPLLALSVAAFPEDLDEAVPAAVFAAAEAQVRAAGALLAGGHTIRDVEPKYGLAVVGTAHPDAVWTNAGARVGDVLLLTKPLGTGLVLHGHARGLVGDADRSAAVDAMRTLNKAVAEALRPFAPTAVTDVTGFGLLGHAHELAAASGVRVRLAAAALPALPGALDVARAGERTGGDWRNREYVAGAATFGGVSDELVTLALDPQTAGGLLVALPSDCAVTAVAALKAAGVAAARIGRVESGQGVVLGP
jgi:selenide, water dikinase